MSWDWSAFEGSAEMLRYMKRDVSYLKATIAKHVPADRRRVAVQAGGCLGIFPKFLSTRFASVYTFEPDPENFLTMCRNAPERNIVKLQAALGHQHELVNISHERWSRKPGTAHEGIRHVSGAGSVPTLLIDDLGLQVCDLIYLDVEGRELFALTGAHYTVDRCHPIIAIEMNEMMTHYDVKESDIRLWFSEHCYTEAAKVGSSDHLFVPAEAAA